MSAAHSRPSGPIPATLHNADSTHLFMGPFPRNARPAVQQLRLPAQDWQKGHTVPGLGVDCTEQGLPQTLHTKEGATGSPPGVGGQGMGEGVPTGFLVFAF